MSRLIPLACGAISLVAYALVLLIAWVDLSRADTNCVEMRTAKGNRYIHCEDVATFADQYRRAANPDRRYQEKWEYPRWHK